MVERADSLRARRARRPRRVAAALALASAGVAALVSAGASPARAAGDLDYGYFKERIEPVLQSVCAQCHAGKGKGQFALVVHAAGAAFPDADHRTNFETVSRLVVPGKPEQSKFLLKPLAEKDGGVKHGGGDRIFKGTPAYKTWVDFIQGERGSVASASATNATGGPDFGFFLANVEPVLQGVCSQCHAGNGKGQFALIVHVGGTRFPIEDHRKNFETVSRLLVPGKPDQSKFLLKPLAEKDGGVKHGGGDRIAKGDANYRSWVDFINGVKGPAAPAETAEPDVPGVSDKGLVLEAESMTREGDASVVDGPARPEWGDGSKKVVAPGAGGARLSTSFKTLRAGEYAVSLRVGPGRQPLRIRLDGGEALEIESPATAPADVAPRLVLDGGKPVEAPRGSLVVDGDKIRMDGRQGVARFFAAADLAHTRVDAIVSLPAADDPAFDDAWLLFDCANEQFGHFFGLSDAGKKVVMGVIEEGRPRVLKSVPRPEGSAGRTLSVEFQAGIAIGRLDGKAVTFVNFDSLYAGKFGFLTHGVMTVEECVAKHDAEEVHRVKPSVGGVVNLRRSTHRLEIQLLPGSGPLDAVVVKEVPR
jgi:hypothetical protein